MKRIIYPALISIFFVAGCSHEMPQGSSVVAAIELEETSHMLITPEPIPTEINVFLYYSAIVNESGTVVLKGHTNLPDGMEIMIGIKNEDGYFAQDKIAINEGAIQSGVFSNKGDGLEVGVYSVEITSPTASVQPAQVKRLIGENGSYLKGNIIKSDSVYGNMLLVKGEFKVKEVTQKVTITNKEIYEYMMKEFDKLTNYGENYDPELHDPIVIKRASERFNISETEVDKLFMQEAMSGF